MVNPIRVGPLVKRSLVLDKEKRELSNNNEEDSLYLQVKTL